MKFGELKFELVQYTLTTFLLSLFFFFRMLATVVFLGTTQFLNVFAVICRYTNVEPLLSATLKRDTSQKTQKQIKGQLFYLFSKPVRHCFKL